MIRRPRILVVDDEPHLRKGLRRILSEEGYEVMTAPDGETALALATEKKPDIVVLDIMMPGMDGREVCRRLREVAAEVKIIYLTAKVESTGPLQSKHLRGEADAFIAKPATSKRILTKIESLLHSSQEQPTTEDNNQPFS
jgi:two-component system OmpR family response regulator